MQVSYKAQTEINHTSLPLQLPQRALLQSEQPLPQLMGELSESLEALLVGPEPIFRFDEVLDAVSEVRFELFETALVVLDFAEEAIDGPESPFAVEGFIVEAVLGFEESHSLLEQLDFSLLELELVGALPLLSQLFQSSLPWLAGTFGNSEFLLEPCDLPLREQLVVALLQLSLQLAHFLLTGLPDPPHCAVLLRCVELPQLK